MPPPPTIPPVQYNAQPDIAIRPTITMVGESLDARNWSYCRSPLLAPGFYPEQQSASVEIVRVSEPPFPISDLGNPPLWFQGVAGPWAFGYDNSAFPPPNNKVLVRVGNFNVGGTNDYESTDTYAPNLIDDEEVQTYWVGLDATAGAAIFTLTYDALNGLIYSYQDMGIPVNGGFFTIDTIDI